MRSILPPPSIQTDDRSTVRAESAMCYHSPTRRSILSSTVGLFAGAFAPPLTSRAGARDPRFLAVILRGGLDGLSLVAPLGDPQYENIRGDLAIGHSGPNAGLPLDGFFALNPRMPTLAWLFGRGEAVVVHAVATPYRERSHFDGQDVLESGMPAAGFRDSGWLNRLVGLLSELAPDASRGRRTLGFAAGAQLPLIMRGRAPVLSWLPPGFRSAAIDTKLRLMDVYQHTDPELAAALRAGLDLEARTGGEQAFEEGWIGAGDKRQVAPQAKLARAAAVAAGKLIIAPDGPRVAVLDVNGFDTHVGQAPVEGPLGNLLAGLDTMIAALRETLEPVWEDTVAVLLTEFGRTVAVNGTAGTDHGMATAALLVGGALKGGRVISTWPGLRPAELHEGRDLRPTLDLRAVLKGLLHDHFDVPRLALDSVVFPGSEAVAPQTGLLS